MSQKQKMDLNSAEHNAQVVDTARRRFLGQAAGATAVIAPGITLMTIANAEASSEGASSAKRWGMLIDTNRCEEGCKDCVIACQQENGWGIGSTDESLSNSRQKAQWIRTVTVRDTDTGHTNQLPMMCQHCEHPPCVDVCPTGASMKRADGIVLVDKHICIGCRYCMMACPYKARSFIHESMHDQKSHAPRGKGTVESCTMCVHRVDRGDQPACVESCDKGAMMFGDLNDPNSEISKKLATVSSTQIRADLGTSPGVRYSGI
ncbi:MAG: 4Fe-4S dicluster domain-containing protein [Gammaproteobacteria bacterium]|jgi:molybdopterin-containing oxidoreductase family iron-sulfur binding subunit|nr:4Fe-4S dicluster domain-containing protein [Gammaproteobacteria bacterium]MBT3490466.1 4Fe-4S dicluster domain-containing protein [Gammaproteobacteria bacterium]MBT3717603.1 4Fe-4S dicluster domain-containing protein [Gammaproteobacteria bacterium]MBT3845796.1 4Fe-4S dicluster domain-containing protein [Gammaproteobacteria bacterium]MBT3893596.1 4Fe-4S dicluster domain-containing protein [Gammaproteobacteria bacterium]